MADALSRMLADRDWLLADGATGTPLFNMGLGAEEPAEFWNTDQPDRVRDLHRAAVAAGADLVLTNSYGANAGRLAAHSAADRVPLLNRTAAALAREIADAAPRPVIVAGAMGPSGGIFAPMGTMTHALAVEILHEQAAALKEGGVDVLWAETLSAPEDLRAAAEAALRTEMPWCVTMNFDTAGRTMMGVTPAQMVDLIEKLPNPPVAFGANCGTGASDLLRSIAGLIAQGTERPVIAKANAGVPRYRDGHIHHDGTPDLMADYAVLARDLGARIIGGCCGTTPAHLVAMRTALETRPRGPRPALDTITTRLGGFAGPRGAE